MSVIVWSLLLSLLVVSIVKQVVTGNGLPFSDFSDGGNRKTEGTEKDNKQQPKQAGVLRVTQTQIADCRRNTKGHRLRYL